MKLNKLLLNPIMDFMYYLPTSEKVFVLHKHPSLGYGFIDDDAISYTSEKNIVKHSFQDMRF